MTALSNEQIQQIAVQLEKEGLSYQPLQAELLDHACCVVEAEMNRGLSFEEARTQLDQTFGANSMLTIQQHTINLVHQKKITMKKISLLMLLLMLGVFTYSWALQQEPPSIAPTTKQFKLASTFGMHFHPIFGKKKMHKGVDLIVPVGTPIVATSAGVIVAINTHRAGYGKHIIIKHDNQYQSLYAHLSDFKVKTGQKVKQGELIGWSGNTGASTAPHLHYEVMKDGKNVDPKEYF
ncbi:MAG: M23 family metallopeptidase [Saprospiraceae bacterium]